MKRLLSAFGIGFFLLASCVPPSWAWWRGGFRGRWGIDIGVPGPWLYPYPYYYDYPEYYPPPYASSPLDYYNAPRTYTSAATVSQSEDNSQYDLRTILNQIAQRRSTVEFQLSDGDISQAQHDTEMTNLARIQSQARDEAQANGGALSAAQSDALWQGLGGGPPPTRPSLSNVGRATTAPAVSNSSHHDLGAINDLLLELHTLLDQKLKDGAITKPQHSAESKFLDHLGSQSREEAVANGGTLTAEQEELLIRQLHQAYYLINHDLIAQ